MNRRDFIRAGSLGLGILGTGLPNLYAQNSSGHKKSVIFIFLSGGMTHAESFNAAPDSIDRYRSVTGYVKTKGGLWLGGNWEKLANSDSLYTLVHSFGHQNPGHQGGTVWVNSGYNFTDENQGANQLHPSYGSIVSKVYGSNQKDSGLPNYVSTGRLAGQQSAFLGTINNPFTVDNEGKKNLSLNIDSQRFNDRFNTLRQLDKRFSDINSLKIADEYKTQAYDVVFGASSKIFDIDKEPDNIKSMYGNSQIGKHLLLARRLVQNGCKFVTAVHGGWDMHQNIKDGMDRLVPEVDTAISALLNDLQANGLLESTLVVVSTEFGRTPINKDAGRDHWSKNTPLLLAGGNYIGKGVIGEMDRNGFDIKDKPYQPIDLLHTILNFMGINHKQTFPDFAGRPRYLVDGDSKIIS